jgi:hypothetical protein
MKLKLLLTTPPDEYVAISGEKPAKIQLEYFG